MSCSHEPWGARFPTVLPCRVSQHGSTLHQAAPAYVQLRRNNGNRSSAENTDCYQTDARPTGASPHHCTIGIKTSAASIALSSTPP